MFIFRAFLLVLAWHQKCGQKLEDLEESRLFTPQTEENTTNDGCRVCEPNNDVFKSISKEIKSNVFNTLSNELYEQVYKFVMKELGVAGQFIEGDGISSGGPQPPNIDQILEIEAYPVPKKEAIDYLDNDKQKPLQFAQVTIARGSRDPPDVVEYKVGPLPVSNESSIVQIVDDGEIPWKKHPFMISQLTFAVDIIQKAAYQLREIFKYSTGGFCPPYFSQFLFMDDTPGFDCGFVDRFRTLEHPVVNNENRRKGRIFFLFQADTMRYGDSYHLFPVPLSFIVDTTEPNTSSWSTSNFVYCHQGPFATTQELLQKFQSGQLRRCQPATEWGTLANLDQFEIEQIIDTTDIYDIRWSEIFPDAIYTLYGENSSNGQTQPRTVLPQGARFQVLGPNDPTGRRLKWLDWEFHFQINPRSGIAFYDIQFKGDRIVYELSLQEQYVAYSGYGSIGQLQFFDSYFGLGDNAVPLLKGVDCPENALYLSTLKYSRVFSTYEEPDVLCVFEQDMQIPLWRHFQATQGRAFGSRDSQLVVRFVLTLENYDYMYTTAFRQDGSINVQVDMNGYVATNFFDPLGNTWRDGNMGAVIHKYAFGNFHDHLAAWKVDMDIKGPINSFITYTETNGTYKDAVSSYLNFLQDSPQNAYTAQKQGVLQSVFAPPPDNECDNSLDEFLGCWNPQYEHQSNSAEWFDLNQTKYLDIQIQRKEQGRKIDFDKPTIFQFVNEDSINRWGNPRGYTLHLNQVTGQVLSDDHPYLQAAAWAKHHITVTQRKDSEPLAMSTKYDWYLPNIPVVSLNEFVDDENIRNEDLVAWVNVGVNHLPHSEDIPLISAIKADFSIKPRDYFEYMQGINAFEAPVKREEQCAPQVVTVLET